MSHRLVAVRPGVRIEACRADSGLAVRVTVTADVALSHVGRPLELTLDKGWVRYDVHGLSPGSLKVTQLGSAVADIHARLARHWHFDRAGLSAFRLTVGRNEVTLTAPHRLTDNDCKVVFDSVARQYPGRPRRIG